MPNSGTTIRLDPAAAHKMLASECEQDLDEDLAKHFENEDVLSKYGIKFELGRVHYTNKNPVAENAVKEFLKGRLRLKPEGGPI